MKPPLLFKKELGGLRPVNPAAERAMEALDSSGPVRIEIKRTRGNSRRMALYWIILAKAAPALSELCEGPALTDDMLHRVLKDTRGLTRWTTLPSGRRVSDEGSIAFKAMTEPERAEFVDWAFATLAKWLGCTVPELLD